MLLAIIQDNSQPVLCNSFICYCADQWVGKPGRVQNQTILQNRAATAAQLSIPINVVNKKLSLPHMVIPQTTATITGR
jgi:hypothetical protein